jgi:7-cyano-7-deazaguanine reductase
VNLARDVSGPGMCRCAGGICDHWLPERVRVPGFHRRSLVGGGERGEYGVAAANVLEVAFDDLGLVADSVSAEIAAHRVDRLEARGAQERRTAAAVLLRERRPGEIDAGPGALVFPLQGHRAAYSTAMDGGTRSTEFVALGHPGSEHYAGLESFANPGVSQVDLTSDELVAVCPITGQPDLYVASIAYTPKDLCLESKSLKLYLNSFRNEGVFCEALAVRIRDDVAEALGLAAGDVRVTLTQKARGGITVTATS